MGKNIQLISKDGVQVMELEDSAHDTLIATLKAQGWQEPSYYCKNCGEVPASEGLCKCFGKKEGEMSLKYGIGDRVIVKASGEKGIVCDTGLGTFTVYVFSTYTLGVYHKAELLTNLTAIVKPFGMLSNEVQNELKEAENGENIQFYIDGKWCAISIPSWVTKSAICRISPIDKEEVKELTINEIEKLVGCRVKVVK